MSNGKKCCSSKLCKGLAVGLGLFFLFDAIVIACLVVYSKTNHAQTMCKSNEGMPFVGSICSTMIGDARYDLPDEIKAPSVNKTWSAPIFRFPPKPSQSEQEELKTQLGEPKKGVQGDEAKNRSPRANPIIEDLLQNSPQLSKKRTPPGLFVCPSGGDRPLFCSALLRMASVNISAHCSNMTDLYREGILCCGIELAHVKHVCLGRASGASNIEVVPKGDFWSAHLLVKSLRDSIYEEALIAYRMLSVRFGVNLEFSLFMLNHEKDRVNGRTQEHRRFLSDGSLFCYQLGEKTTQGRAKVAPCPVGIRNLKLDLSKLEFYKLLGNNTAELALPSWKEYCPRKDVC